MKRGRMVKVKTLEQLRAEGWKSGSFADRFNRNTSLYFGPTRKEIVFKLSHYQEAYLLGKEAEVVEVDFDQQEPRVRIRLGTHSSWVPWTVIDGNMAPDSRFPSPRIKKFPFGKVKHTPGFVFNFSCSMADLSEEDVLILSRWIAGQLGYELNRRGKTHDSH